MGNTKKYTFITFPALPAKTPFTKSIGNGKPVKRSVMQNMVVKYIERLQSATTPKQLKKEPLVIYISKVNLTALMNDQNCKGLVAMLAIELNGQAPDHQTFALAPCDENGNLIPLPVGNTWVENWPISPISVSNILDNGPGNAPKKIEDAVNDYFNSIGV